MTLRSSAALLAGLVFAAPLAAQAGVVVRAENPLNAPRPDETLSVSWATLQRALPALRPNLVRVVDAGTGAEVLSQPLDANGDGTMDELLFQTAFWPRESKEFRVEARAAATAKPRVFVLHDEHRDDMAWETENIAWRMYGQGLWNAHEYEPLVSSGVDVWVKRTRNLVVQKWYSSGHDNYHVDRGEGADFYTVGPTLGAGGTAVWRDGKMYSPKNFRTHRILASGPIRVLFEMGYDAFDAGGVQVTETRRVSMDAGQNFFRSESTYRTADNSDLTYVTGTVKREGIVGSANRAGPFGWVATWGPVELKNGGHGSMGTAVLMEKARMIDTRETSDHFLGVATARSGVPAVHYVGAGWTASGDFDTVEDWWSYLDGVGQRLAAPVRVTVAPAAR